MKPAGGIMSHIQGQEAGCKLFIGGLTWNTTKEMLYEEFSKYGEIVDFIVMKNPETGASRGFGFVTFKESSSAEMALRSGPHKIDGKNVDVKLCNPKQQQNNAANLPNKQNSSYSQMMPNQMGTSSANLINSSGSMSGGMKFKNENCKVFVGGLPNGVSEEEIKQFFSRYGPVREFKIYYDEVKQKPKGKYSYNKKSFFFRLGRVLFCI
jgi:RNA-binding protein Musashi